MRTNKQQQQQQQQLWLYFSYERTGIYELDIVTMLKTEIRGLADTRGNGLQGNLFDLTCLR